MRMAHRTPTHRNPLSIFLLALAVFALIAVPGCGRSESSGTSSGGGTPHADVMSDEVAESIDTINGQVLSINTSYEADGYVPADYIDDAVDEVAQSAEAWKQDGTITDYEVTDDSVALELPDGVIYVYAPMQEDALGGTGEFKTDEELGLVTLEPMRGDFPDSCTPYLDMTDESAAMVAGLSDKWGWSGYDQQEVTLDLLDDVLGQDGIYIWKGHGGFVEWVGPYLGTSEPADVSRMRYDGDYYEMFTSNELVVCGGDTQRIGICAGFVRNHLNSLDGSIVFLDACHTAEDDRLSDAFLDRGAIAALGFDDTVSVSYASNFMHGVFERFSTADSTTGEYPMLSDAVEGARDEFGDADPHYSARPILSGTAEGLSAHIVSDVEVELPSVSYPSDTIELPYTWTNGDVASLYAEALWNGTYSYVAFCDLNEDGIPEMLASSGDDGESNRSGLYYASNADLYTIAPDGAPVIVGNVNGMDHISWSSSYKALRQSWGGSGSVQYMTFEFNDFTLTERTYSMNDSSSYQIGDYTFLESTFTTDWAGNYDYKSGSETVITRGDYASALKAWDADRAYVGFRSVDSLSISGWETNNRANGYTDDEIVALARTYASSAYGETPQYIDVDGHDGNTVTLHLYNMVNDGASSHTGTVDWLYIDRYTLEGTNLLGEYVHL